MSTRRLPLTLSPTSASRLLAALVGLGSALPAHAVLTIWVERRSDIDAVMHVSGLIDAASPGGNAHALALMDPFSTRPADTDNSWVMDESDLHAGAFLFNFANQAGRCIAQCPGTPVSPGVVFDNSGRANTIYFGNNDLVFPLPFPFQPIPVQTPLTGSMSLQLQNGATLAPVGATGDVYWGTTATMLGLGVWVGTWSMTPAVPEPGTYALLLPGLGLMAWAARRRRPDKSG